MAKKKNDIPDNAYADILEFVDDRYDGTNKMKVVQECADFINEKYNLSIGESAVRKIYDRVSTGVNIGIVDKSTEDELERLAKAEARALVAQKQNGRVRALVNDMAREVSDNGLLKDIILNKYNFYREPLDTQITYSKIADSDEHVVYIFSDAHFGKNVNLEKNKHNYEIAKKKLTKFFDYVKLDIKKNKYKKVSIFDLGDSIEGSALRTSQLLEINELLIEQANTYSDFIQGLFFDNFIDDLKHVKIDFNMVTSDNHGQLRQHNTGRNELKKDNIMILVAHDFDRTLQREKKRGNCKNFTFNFADTFLVDYDGYKVFYEHGHEQTKKEQRLSVIDDKFDIRTGAVVAGHWHSWSLKTKGLMKNRFGIFSLQRHLIYVPGVVGADDYSESLGVFSGAGGLKIIFDGDTGVKQQQFINLQNV